MFGVHEEAAGARHPVLPKHTVRSDRKSSEMDYFQKPTTYEQHVYTRSEKKKITFARHEYGREGVYRIKMKSLEVIASRKVPIFQLFQSDCITL